MSELKKRAASSDGTAQVKKPKFEKKSFPKKNAEHQNKKKGNPFEKKGMQCIQRVKRRTHFSCTHFFYISTISFVTFSR